MPEETNFSDFKIDGRAFQQESISLNLNRDIGSDNLPGGNIKGGVMTVTLDLQSESDSDTFFASWLQDPSQKKKVEAKLKKPSDSTVFLTVTMTNSSCVGYSFTHNQTGDTAAALLTVLISSIAINIGAASLKIT